MTYNNFITSQSIEHHQTKCLHGINKDSCGYCNGIFYKKAESKKVNDDQELIKKYETLKSKFKNFNEDWTEEEIYIVYSKLNTISKHELKKSIYETAILLERTKNAIEWMRQHIFSKRNDLHRGKIVLEFIKKNNIGV